jgi:outer membrane receptor protein involved in Fe transport
MLATKSWRRGCALAIAALLLVIPASAQVPSDPNEDSESGLTEEPSDLADRDLDESDSEESDFDLEEPDSEDLEETLRSDMFQQASDIEEILVTGEKQNTLQDAPTSSTSFSAGDLQALRIEDISDLADYTPNLEINTAFAASNPTIFIRGIGLKDYNANAAGAVAVYQDGININSPAIQLGQLFDIDGIDVLRGPQGSINGRNATAGAIMIRSAMPDGEFGVSTNLTYGNYDNKEVDAAINIPLIEDMLSMRISGQAQWRDGYTKNQCAGWNPERLGFRRVDAETTGDLYDALNPVGQYEFNAMTGEYELRAAQWLKGNGNPAPKDAYLYLNEDLAIGRGVPSGEKVWQITSGVLVNTEDKPLRLAEDLIDENGNPVFFFDESEGIMKEALAGTPIARQGALLSIRDTDQICILRPPGQIVSQFGASNPNVADLPNWDEGNWRPDRVQPGLEQYANLKPWQNGVENWAARMILLFTPMDNMDWMFNAHGTQNRGDSFHAQMLGATARHEIPGFFEQDQDGFSDNSAAINSDFRLGEGVRRVRGVVPSGSPPVINGEGGGNPYSGFYDSDGIEYIDAWGINGRGFWDLGAVVITLLYDYEWYERTVEDEGDANPVRVFPATYFDSAWQTTEELRIEGEGERYKWTTGFFFLYEELTADNLFPSSQNFRVEQKFSNKLTSWAPYANAEIELVEEGVIPGIYQLTLGAGLRYNQEKKIFSLKSTAIGTDSLVEVESLPEDTAEKTWKEWTGDAQLSYTPFFNEYGTLLSYFKYGHGFKGGHFNAGLTIKGGDAQQDIDPVEPEFIDSIEFGIRSRWFDDRVIFNAAVFRYWYQDLQVFDFVNEAGQLPLQKLLNGDAEVVGAEAELRIRPIPGMLLSLNGGYLDSEFKEFKVTKTILSRRGTPTPHVFDYEGNPLVAAPKWNASVVAEYEIPIFGWGALIPQYNFNWRSKAYLDPQGLDPISMDGYFLHGCRVAYRTPDERIELAFWVSNLLDEEYKIDVFDFSRDSDTILEIWGKPRTYGVTLSLNW